MKKLHLFPFVLLLLPLVLNLGCGGTGSTGNDDYARYYLTGGLVKNLDLGVTQAVAYMEKNDSLFGGAIIAFGNDTLEYSPADELYQSEQTAAAVASGNYFMQIKDSPGLNETLTYAVPGDFQITSIQLPDNRVNNGGDPVPIEWSLSLGGDGYFYGVILKDSAYSEAGYSEFVTTGAASATIPRDAFQIYSDLDTGWYYVYVCSYSGSPASDFNLPTTIPPGLTEDIAKVILTGQFGTIVVTPHDSIHVTVQQ